MKKFFRTAFLFGTLAFLFPSCASVTFIQKEEDVLALVGLINRGDIVTLSALSSVPFLFDREILTMNQDPGILWSNLAAAGFSLPGAVVVKIDRVDEKTSTLFDDSMEVRVFFSKYVPDTARFAVLEAEGTSAILILDGKREGYPKILGMKVN